MRTRVPARTTAVLALCLASALAGAAPPPAAEDTIEVVASNGGFKPKLLNARKGETVRLLLETADDEHCFAVDALRIEKRILPGKTTTLDLTPDRTGTFPFHCCLEPGSDTMRGRLVVTE